MKGLKGGLYVLGMGLVGLAGAMALTNPGEAAYQDYATQQLSRYLRENACSQVDTFLRQPCMTLIDQNQTQIGQFISAGTRRRNYLVLSVYETNLSAEAILPPFLSGLLPAYEFGTVGVFNSFHTFRAERQN